MTTKPKGEPSGEEDYTTNKSYIANVGMLTRSGFFKVWFSLDPFMRRKELTEKAFKNVEERTKNEGTRVSG